MTTIALYFDFLSPYAYLAWHAVYPLAGRHGARVEPVPVLLAAMLNHHGQKGPAEIPAKREWTFREVWRRARMAGLTLEPPPSHPFNPLCALRVAGDPELQDGERRRLCEALFAVAWGGVRPLGNRQGLESPDVVRAVANAGGLDGGALIERASEAPAKQRLKQATDEAITRGVFGVPTMIVQRPGREELFWGYDSLDLVERLLAGEDPLSDELLASWRDLPQSASRR